ncbi:hypothetical protein L3Y34_019355 [Caenorhabditis briggsae]|uniref:DUF7809 domain-containing protein n=2 Tax=Caenorhabditis briggsae TaxID=6238 RepID=A0AAE9DNY2_CAEBR|nr:hypothetical protein L3Y34_019355 [Caenorhabditis briggsae]
MFESPEELWDDVQVYIDFQGNNKYFGLDPSIHYNHTLRIYRNQNKTKEYIQKNDIFLNIQNYLLHKDPSLENRVALIMLSYYFKLEEKKLEDTCEFVEFEKKAFDTLDMELNKLLADMRKTIRIEAMGLTCQKMLKKFQKLLPVPMSEKEMEALMGVLKHLFSLAQCTQKDAENVSVLMYTYCATLILGVQKIVKRDHSGFFLKANRIQNRCQSFV